jgi:ABC-type amino acid transport substrate-binding protein
MRSSSSARARRVSTAAPRRGAPLLVALSLVVVLALGAGLLVACGSSGSSGGGASPAASTAAPASSSPAGAAQLTAEEKAWLAENTELAVGAFDDYPPFSFVADEGGEPAGIAIDYWTLLGERLGVKVAFSPTSFNNQLDWLKTGKVDSLTGIFALPEREQWFAFSRPWMAIDTRIFADAGHTDATTLEKLKTQDLMVAVVKGDSGQSIADDAGLTTLVVEGYDDAVKAVGTGKAQATILDEPVGVFYAKEFGYEGKVVAVGKPVAAGMMTLPVLKENTMLLGILDKGIAMIGDSEFEGILEKYVGNGGQ